MAKNKISEWSSNPSNNTDIGGIDIAEGCAPSGINNGIRELMAQVKDMVTGADGDSQVVGGNLSVTGTTTLNNELITNGSAGTSGQVLSSRGTGLSPQYQTLNLSAAGISNTPAGNISATNVQGAINELDTEKQAALGFTPVQQGGGSGQFTNKVYVGWSGSALKAQVDATDLGSIWTGQITTSGLGSNGYQKFPSGLIMQWGTVSVPNDGSATVTFPIAFSTSVFNVQLAFNAPLDQFSTGELSFNNVSTTTMQVHNGRNVVSTVNWLSIGF
jgi:hypothetical protein